MQSSTSTTATPTPATAPAPDAPAPTASSSKPAKSARGRPTDSDDMRFSKTLSYILRHGAAKESLVLRPDGFVRVSELMKRPKLKGLDLDTMERIVRDNEKQRFTIRIEPTGKDGEEEKWIRANQGHSVVVESLELTPVAKVEEVPLMVHGTYSKFWDSIGASESISSSFDHAADVVPYCPNPEKEGLKRMTRNHIHCAVGLAGDDGVTSGMRANCDVFIYLDVPALLADAIPIFTSTNGVLLTPGVEGIVPPKYFQKVVKKSGEILR